MPLPDKVKQISERWATERLKEYMIKGFTIDDERLIEKLLWKQKRIRRCEKCKRQS